MRAPNDSPMTEDTTEETMTTRTPIRTIPCLIARLEEVRADLDTRHLTTLRQYEHVGWALRPLDTLLDQCREEAESLRWQREQAKLSLTAPSLAALGGGEKAAQ